MTDRTRTISEPSRDIPVLGEYEVVVLGGGPAGIAAATAAGKAGRSTLLIERYGFLGGAGTAAGLSTFCGLYANVHGEHRRVVRGVADELLERLERKGGLNAPHLSFADKIQAQAYDMSAYKIVADEMLAAAGVEILFHAFGVGAVMASDHDIGALLVETKSGRGAIVGKLFIDGSGDGDLAAWAGAPFDKGSTAETLTFPTTMFMISGVDAARAGRAWETIPKLMDEAERKGRTFPRKGAIVRPQKNPVQWRANATQVKNPDGSPVDGTDVLQLSRAEIEGRRQCWEVFEFIRESTPGFENAFISEMGTQLGIRESRRIIGDYLLTEDDCLNCADFDDAIGVNGWPVERHVAGSVLIKFPPIPQSRGFNQLPYRMIVPQRIENLLVIGRCASMTHEGQSAARVSGSCFAMGQAAGTAADIVLKTNAAPRNIGVAALQARLEQDGAYLGKSW
jgi:FAD dependent oxidoreductase